MTPGEVLEINRVRRAKPVRSVEDLIPAQPSTTPVVTDSRAESSGSDEDEVMLIFTRNGSYRLVVLQNPGHEWLEEFRKSCSATFMSL